jgi:hypothetical protein
MVDLGNFRFDVKRAGDRVRPVLDAAGRAAWTGLTSAGNLAWAVGLTAAGGLVGFEGLIGVRTPDAALLEQAKESARAAAAAAATRSAVTERDVYLFLLAFGVALVLGGIWSLYAWWRDPLGKGKAKTPA